MPTRRPRHMITETPNVQAALDELRALTGAQRIDIAELVVLGAQTRAAELRRIQAEKQRLRDELADAILAREDIFGDVEAADEVKRTGWSRELG